MHNNCFWLNRPFPSSLVPLFQNESKCKTFHMKMSSACSFILMQIKVIFIRMVSHLNSLWNRDTRELGNGLSKCPTSSSPLQVNAPQWGPTTCQMPWEGWRGLELTALRSHNLYQSKPKTCFQGFKDLWKLEETCKICEKQSFHTPILKIHSKRKEIIILRTTSPS